MKYDKIAVLIPSFNPNEKLLKTIENLNKKGFNNIFVVDDGSVNKEIFSKIDNVLINENNKGKGYSLKKGIKHIDKLNYEGIITIDDDMQQDFTDIIKIGNLFLNKKEVYIGVRTFDKAPLIRKISNKICSFLFRLIYKKNIKDTQTGLRCFPKEIFKDLVKIKGDRFEYETNVLKFLTINKIDINEVIIKTIYNDSKSHFSPLKDSFKIIKVIIDKKSY